MSDDAPRPIIMKLDASGIFLDRWRDALVGAGYQVIRAIHYEDGLRLAQRTHPALILVLHEPKKGVDAIHWLELQHGASDPVLPMIPLLIITEQKHGAEAQLHELPDRVRVLVRPLENEELLTMIKALITAWQ